MSKFEIEGQQYRAGKLNAFAQLHVARKIAPVLGGLAALQGADSAAALKSLADVIAAMPDADCEYVLHTCLSVTQRQNGKHFSPVWNAQNQALMFDDIGLSEMVQIAMYVIQDSLGNFLRGLTERAVEASPATAANG
ncbi:conserved phage-related hypothetical protein [Candidatus Glomeribacter gigasporarum BEG34]|uniref:Bacteriophage protein n=1 Tax=Candidatus Glomeribacter gigasporarum BEG34 TaxID=1070319 RepID=G2JC53_9BURK|nr:hypothetical protein [Candidatus Glomeribacter gigasporarum]CCD30361.1 conserved phage-related hypothetical protein [Candidatus Glomeribacter gigasporarum BEG34]